MAPAVLRRLQCGHSQKAVENLINLSGIDLDLKLQCGHSQKAVENAMRPSVMTKWQRLQCGHSQKAVENHRGAVYNYAQGHASMRPQPEGRGELSNFAVVVRVFGASMRPQPEGRGERSSVAGCTSGTRLQCGHSQKAVENVVGLPTGLQLHSASMRPQPEGRGEP